MPGGVEIYRRLGRRINATINEETLKAYYRITPFWDQALTAPAISTNQHPLRLGIEGMAHFSPPTANALHGKTRRIMGAAHGHPPLIVLLIVDTTRYRLG